jgi:hypothetical protein
MMIIIVNEYRYIKPFSPFVTKDFMGDGEAGGALRWLPPEPFYYLGARMYYTHHKYELGVFPGELHNFFVLRGARKKLALGYGAIVTDFEIYEFRIEAFYSGVIQYV